MYHTARAADPNAPPVHPGADQPIVALTFIAGVAMDVPLATYDLFASLGIATTERPRRQWELDDEESR